MNEKETKNISSILLEVMKQKGVSPEKLSELTGVHINIINNLLNDKFEKLPAAPYLHGYIMKISDVLGLSGTKVWKEFLKNEERIKKSGKKDVLPKSKDVSGKRKAIIITALVVILLAIFLFSSYALNRPELSINLKEDLITTTTQKITLSGTLKKGDKLLLNGKLISLNEKGEFAEEIILQPGFNTFIFEASKILGKGIKETKQVYYENKDENISTSSQNIE